MHHFLHLFILTRPSPTSPTFFFFNDTATTEIYTLSLHDALPISQPLVGPGAIEVDLQPVRGRLRSCLDRKSTRLNSSHSQISYAVFCLKKKKKKITILNNHKYKTVIGDTSCVSSPGCVDDF